MSVELLRQRARDNYERGRLRGALPDACAALGLGALATLCGCSPVRALALSLLLAAGVAFLSWHSRSMRRASRAGLVSGLVPFALPLAACGIGGACEPGSCLPLMTAAALGGAGAGILIALLAARSPERARPIIVAAFVAFGAGTLGCSAAGLLGALALAAGLVATTAPVLVLRRA